MFKSIRNIPGRVLYTYTINDTCCSVLEFAFKFNKSRNIALPDRVVRTVAVIDYYNSQHLNIAKNLARFYQYTERHDGYHLRDLLNAHRSYFDNLHPSIGFGKKYYQAIRQYLRH